MKKNHPTAISATGVSPPNQRSQAIKNRANSPATTARIAASRPLSEAAAWLSPRLRDPTPAPRANATTPAVKRNISAGHVKTRSAKEDVSFLCDAGVLPGFCDPDVLPGFCDALAAGFGVGLLSAFCRPNAEGTRTTNSNMPARILVRISGPP